MKQNLELRIKQIELNSHSKDEVKKLESMKRYEEIFTEKKKKMKERKQTDAASIKTGMANMKISLL